MIRKQDVGMPRSQRDVREELFERGGDSVAAREKMA